MSALGQKRTHAAQQIGSLFDQFIGAADQCVGHAQTQRLGGLEVLVERDRPFDNVEREFAIGAIVVFPAAVGSLEPSCSTHSSGDLELSITGQ